MGIVWIGFMIGYRRKRNFLLLLLWAGYIILILVGNWKIAAAMMLGGYLAEVIEALARADL